ncbi:Hsp20/alpha crystallin family protein [Bacillus sp. BRMEA1]|uniref:Hsp20/alpha crystallin family protein n=1 Tax=Neobacillus endophyticus TaxID=2738405 RepID=UPI0015666A71|nr:Hsp20/alpha crystallin family protein [Neobacillus endophyticus]NRD80383.1 Hsp20/alpha crystallin family protein [Neobacillus endophyticus]
MTYLAPFKKRARDLSTEMWDSFSDFFNDNFFAPVHSETNFFRTDVRDCSDHYVVEAELPGFSKEDIKVEYDHHYLTISAKRESHIKDEMESFIRQERHFGEFVRRFYAKDINEDTIVATFTNGILTVKCPKISIPHIEQKRIEIH